MIMYKNSINNQCFEPSTLLQYRTEINGQIYMRTLIEVYAEQQANPDMTVYVPVIYRTDSEYGYKGMITWQEATICETQSMQCVTIVVGEREGQECHTELTENRIRVTPNHVFIIERDGNLKEEEAYLVQDGDKVLFEAHRIYEENESPMFISENGDIASEDLLAEASEHTVMAVEVKKSIIAMNYNKKKPWMFYGIVLTESKDKCVLMPTGLISHDSSVTY